MWNDVETTQDLLNFKVVVDTAALTLIITQRSYMRQE
jgi:hypothetical protein